jgi:hypothetical protein
MFRRATFILFVVLSAFILVMWAWSHISPLSWNVSKAREPWFRSLLLANGLVVYQSVVKKEVLLTDGDAECSRYFEPDGYGRSSWTPDPNLTCVSSGDFYFRLERRLATEMTPADLGPAPSPIPVRQIISMHFRFWLLFVVVAGPVILPVLLHRGLRRWLRARRNQCLKCGYDLRGLPEPRCPECGRTIPAKQFRSSASESFRDKGD